MKRTYIHHLSIPIVNIASFNLFLFDFSTQLAHKLLKALKSNLDYELNKYDGAISELKDSSDDDDDEERFAVINQPYAASHEEELDLRAQLDNFIHNLNE